MRDYKTGLKFSYLDEVRAFWQGARYVPRRTEGRTRKQYERYYLALYLLALAEHGLLSYPLEMIERESPDFIVIWPSGEKTGLEITRATDEEFQAAITRAEREHPEGSAMIAHPLGYAGDQLEQVWCELFRTTAEKKVRKLAGYTAVTSCDLSGHLHVQIAEKASSQGWRIGVVYIGLGSADLAIGRVQQRVSRGGHDVPRADVRRRH